jgi:hypothetical protein
MAAAELTKMAVIASDASRRRLPAGLPAAWLSAYAAVWAVTLTAAALVALAGRPLEVPVRRLLRLALTAHGNPSPGAAHVLALATHNIPIASWPLLLGAIGAHRSRPARRVADSLVAAHIALNALPVGAALGAYGAALLPYVPQLPVEWAGLTLGAGGWLIQRRRALTVGEGTAVFALITAVLLGAAVLETVAVPHR